MDFSKDDLGFLQLASSAVLAAVARGELDIVELCRDELTGRGQDDNGKWIGFNEATKLRQHAK